MGFRGLFLHFLLRERKQRKTGGSKIASKQMAGPPIDYLPRSRLGGVNISSQFFYARTKKYRYTSIPVVVPIVIAIVMVTMMVPVPSLPLVPAIFVCVIVIAVAVPAIVIRSVLWVSGANLNAKALICLGFGGCQGNQPEHRQP